MCQNPRASPRQIRRRKKAGMDLRRSVDRIQNLVAAETGQRLGADAEAMLAKMLRNIAAGNSQGQDGFAYRELTILFADLRGFMSISDRYPPEVVLQVLNRCLITMTEVVFAHEGTIDKFMGDSIMARFGEAPSGRDPAQRAVACAVDLQIAMDRLNAQQRHSALPERAEPLDPAPEVKIRIDLPLVNHRAADVYGRVKKCTLGAQR